MEYNAVLTIDYYFLIFTNFTKGDSMIANLIQNLIRKIQFFDN
jgi:hypothetical protein